MSTPRRAEARQRTLSGHFFWTCKKSRSRCAACAMARGAGRHHNPKGKNREGHNGSIRGTVTAPGKVLTTWARQATPDARNAVNWRVRQSLLLFGIVPSEA